MIMQEGKLGVSRKCRYGGGLSRSNPGKYSPRCAIPIPARRCIVLLVCARTGSTDATMQSQTGIGIIQLDVFVIRSATDARKFTCVGGADSYNGSLNGLPSIFRTACLAVIPSKHIMTCPLRVFTGSVSPCTIV